MTVNGRRRFVSNTGKKYYVSDMCKQDMAYGNKDLKYVILEEGGIMCKV